jgi:Flp pilus assembly pilin Flp
MYPKDRQADHWVCRQEAGRQEVTMLALWTKVLDWAKNDEKGAGLVEYALLVVLIALIAFIAIQFLGENVSTVFSNIAESTQGAATP